MLTLRRPFYNPPGWPRVQPHAPPPPPPRGKPMTCALQLYNHHASMSYKKQLPVALPGHGCAAPKIARFRKKILNLQKTIIQRPISKSFTKKKANSQQFLR